MSRSALTLTVFCAAAFTTGCSMLKPVEDPTAYYRLTAEHFEMAGPAELADISVKTLVSLEMPADVHSNKLALVHGSNEVAILDEARWMEPFENAFERSLDLNVRALLGASAPNTLKIEVEVLTFDTRDGEVVCRFSYNLMEGRKDLDGRLFEVSQTFDVDAPLEDLVGAIDGVSAKMAELLVAVPGFAQ